MALHIMPSPEDGHRYDETCPCSPAWSEGTADHPRGRGRQYRGSIFTHRPFTEAPTPHLDEDHESAAAACGHVVVETEAGEWQHHQIPDDGEPHAPTSECGCQPQRDVSTGHVVYVHADPSGDADAALWDEIYGGAQ